MSKTDKNVLTTKQTKIFHRRNKVKVLLCSISIAGGIGAGIGIGYALFHKDQQPNPCPGPTDLTLTYSSSEYTFEVDSTCAINKPVLKDNNGNDVTATYSSTNLPNWITLDETDGSILLKPETLGDYEITVLANGTGIWKGLTASQKILINIVNPPAPIPTSLALNYSSSSFLFEINTASTTDLPTLEDNNGNIATAIYKITSGTLPPELNIDEDTGEILGVPKSKGEYHITITATGTNEWSNLDASQTITINTNYVNSIILNDNTEIKITDPNGLMTFNSFSPTRLNNDTYTSSAITNVNLIKEIYVSLDQSITKVEDGYGAFLCYGMSNLEFADIKLPQSITSAGKSFASYMFGDCTSLTSLSDDFNLPQGINQATDSFAYAMFSNCGKLSSLPSNFNLPQSITLIGTNFALAMFYGCSSLTALPNNFNFPQGVTSVGSYFACQMFMSCFSLTTFPNGFNLPSSLSTVADNFACALFSNCTSLQGTGNSGTPNFYSPISSGSYTSYATDMFAGATILLGAGCDVSPTVENLNDGYNIARN